MKSEDRVYVDDGDIVFIRSNAGIYSKIIRAVTRSKFTHCAIAFWITSANEKRLMLVEATGGTHRRIVNASFYSYEEMTVVEKVKNWNEIESSLLSKVALEPYSYLEAVRAGVSDYLLKNFNISINIKGNLKGEICSEMVARVIGLDRVHVSPGKLFDILTKEMNKKVKFG